MVICGIFMGRLYWNEWEFYGDQWRLINGDSNRDIHGKHGRNSETAGSDLGDRPLIGSCWWWDCQISSSRPHQWQWLRNRFIWGIYHIKGLFFREYPSDLYGLKNESYMVQYLCLSVQNPVGYPLVICYIAMAHRNRWFSYIRWWFSSSLTISLPEGND